MIGIMTLDDYTEVDLRPNTVKSDFQQLSAGEFYKNLENMDHIKLIAEIIGPSIMFKA